ncbi:MAG: bifunctional folylpolyglutamate synthase/dihydrofolate synthase [Bacteroidia bacterium]|nr:bifunctional folylpolyglutamate synthase/dihydrofolate synthase [Bacteroidia bacterium]
MSYSQTLQYMYAALPMFHRIGSAAYKANLDNTIAISKLLNNPQHKFKSVHVAGTNGKGSTSHMLAAILQNAGYKVGLYTSPHLKDFRERIRINGKMISKNTVVSFIQKHRNKFEQIQPSFFEMTVGLAFDYFAKQKVDIAIIEVGLGGRLDSTNIITPLLSVITNISFDHRHLLGNTLKKIAAEKAGIIKPGVPVIIGESQKEVKEVFSRKAKECKSKIYFADKYYSLKNCVRENKKGGIYLKADVYRKSELIKKNLYSELSGIYQHKNIATALMVIELLNQILDFKINVSTIKLTNLNLMGRWQLLGKKPFIIADTGHNEAGIKQVLEQIKLTPHHKLHFVLGMVNDKDISRIVKLLPKNALYYFCKPNLPRGLDEEQLRQQALQVGLRGNSFSSVKLALNSARKIASSADLIFVGGSTFVVAEVV